MLKLLGVAVLGVGAVACDPVRKVLEAAETATPTPIPPTETLIPTVTHTPEPTATSTPEATPTPIDKSKKLLEEDLYTVVDGKLTEEEIKSKTDAELLEVCPKFSQEFDFTKYGFNKGEIKSLTPERSMELGKGKYVRYLDQGGKLKMWWNLKDGYIEHAEETSYFDPDTGLTINAYVVTDHSYATKATYMPENQRFFGLDERASKIPEVFAKFTLPLNNAWERHRKDVPGYWELKSRGMNIMADAYLTYGDEVLLKARQRLKEDVAALNPTDELKIPVSHERKMVLNGEKNVDLEVRFRNSLTNNGLGGGYFEPFHELGSFSPNTSNLCNYLKVDVNLNEWVETTGGGCENYVGGFGSGMLRCLTAFSGGTYGIFGDAGVRVSNTFGDRITEEICEQQTLSRYIKSVLKNEKIVNAPRNIVDSERIEYLKNGAIPSFDYFSSSSVIPERGIVRHKYK